MFIRPGCSEYTCANSTRRGPGTDATRYRTPTQAQLALSRPERAEAKRRTHGGAVERGGKT